MYILEYKVYILIHACSAGAKPMFILLVKLDGPSYGHISPSYYAIGRRACARLIGSREDDVF